MVYKKRPATNMYLHRHTKEEIKMYLDTVETDMTSNINYR